MTVKLKWLSGAGLLALAMIASSSPSQAADYVDPGCTLSGSVMAGFMFDWQELSVDDDDSDFKTDLTTPFGEGAGLVTCSEFNIQADFAYYAHSGDFEFDSGDGNDEIAQNNSHIGGALFYRDPTSWAAGVNASWISQDIIGLDIDVFRAGLFGELYLGDAFTLGAAVSYYDSETISEFQDEDGVEITAYGRYYPAPDFSLMLRGDILLANIEFGGEDSGLDGFSITGEAEYLIWDQGLALFAGARYAERDVEIDGDLGGAEDFSIEDMQVFGGIKFYFGGDGTLVERQRNGTIDNTSVFKEKLPNLDFGFLFL